MLRDLTVQPRQVSLRPQIENSFAGTQMPRRITAAIVPLEHLVGNGGEEPRVVRRGAAELGFDRTGAIEVS